MDQILKLRFSLLVAALACALLSYFASLAIELKPQGGDTTPGRYGALVEKCKNSPYLEEVESFARQGRQGRVPYFLSITANKKHFVSTFGPGPQWWGAWTLPTWDKNHLFTDRELRLEARKSSSLALALAVGIFTFGLGATLPSAWAFFGGLLCACSFAGVPVLGQALWQQTMALPLLTLGLCAGAWSISLRGAAIVGLFFLAVGLTIRPPDSPLFIALSVYCLLQVPHEQRTRTWLLSCILSVILGLLPVCLWNMAAFELPWMNGQWGSNQRMTKVLFSFQTWQESLPGLLISPGRGLLWFSPIFFFLPLRASWRSSHVVLAIGILAQFMVIASFGQWWGGISFGPRLLALSHWLVVFYVLQNIKSISKLRRSCLLFACTCSLAVGLLGALRYYPTAWELKEVGLRNTSALFRWSDTAWHEWLSSEKIERAKVKPAIVGELRYCSPGRKVITSGEPGPF